MFSAPSSVICKLERLQRNFLWDAADGAKKFHLVLWENWHPLNSGEDSGDLKVFNKSLWAKWLWRYGIEGWREGIDTWFSMLARWTILISYCPVYASLFDTPPYALSRLSKFLSIRGKHFFYSLTYKCDSFIESKHVNSYWLVSSDKKIQFRFFLFCRVWVM